MEGPMKIKTLITAMTTALYSVGMAQAAVMNDPSDQVHALKAPNVTAEQIKRFQKDLDLSASSMMRNDGLNVQITQQHNKFVVEEGISGEQIYIVRLIANPVSIAANTPNSPIHQALAQAGATKIFSKGQPVVDEIAAYQQQLLNQQQSVISEISSLIGVNDVRQQFTKALNGFSVTMTPEQAQRVSALGSVAGVTRSKVYELLSDVGPKHIGADTIWQGTATNNSMQYKGEGQIIAIVDTGINSDHPSFADIGGDEYNHTNPWGEGVYAGNCADEGLAEFVTCNDKLIGMHSYPVITDSYETMRPGWPAIAEDYQGHGSHVASTAAGNVLKDVDYVLPEAGENADGTVLKAALFPEISGVAPHANIIAYQVCHANNDYGFSGCPGEALLGGIEDAIADGVDVINFSIGGADSNVWGDPVQMAFLSAREAGINVAAAAGNSGQACGEECFGMLDNSSPWLAQVAATTHGRDIAIDTGVTYAGFIDETLGSELPSWSETGLSGGSINTVETTGVVVWAKDYADINAAKDYNGYCVTEYPANTFNFFKDGSEIAGAADGLTNVFVICQRHNPTDPDANARTAKVANVKAGGADGFIMFNRDENQGTTADEYELPSVHFTKTQWNGLNYGYNDPRNTDGLEDWVDSYAEKGHMITIKPTVIERRMNAENADMLAAFSSRGPSYSNVEVLAPAMAAPGVSIFAAYSDEQPFTATPFGQDFNAISGTSMASPHVAGAMALLRQANPTWTASEVQSALSMTADNVVKYHRLNDASDDLGDAEIYRAGTGRINLENAVKSGLIMDETAENFMSADPTNGGTPHKLNMPNLVNFSCAPECQWIRTVKATQDGTWSVSHDDVINWNFDLRKQGKQNGVSIEVTPSEFSLKAGQTQTIVVKASIMDTQDWFSNSEIELHSSLVFNAQEQDIPQARWPVVFKYDRGELPARLQATAHRDAGSYQINDVMLPSTETPFTRVFAPVKANIESVILPKDDEGYFPWAINADLSIPVEDRMDEATHSVMIEVPANSKRLIVESYGATESAANGTLDEGNIVVYVGKDYNGNGQADPFEEILCVSNHISYDNFCNINNPEEGTYWAIFYNPSTWGEFSDISETFSFATAVVSGDVAANMSLIAPSSDGYQSVDLTLDWDMEMMADDVYYTSLDIGTSAVNGGNIGNIPFKLIRGSDYVSLDVPQEQAKTGEQVPFTFAVLANQSGADREFSISATLPDGLTVNPSNVVSSNPSEMNITVDGNKFTITGTQLDTTHTEAAYNITTSLNDAMCRTPDFGNENPGGYVDLATFGIPALFGGFDEQNIPDYRSGTIFPAELLFNGTTDSFHFFNNTEELNVDRKLIAIRGNGFIDLWGQDNFAPDYRTFPYNSFPYEGLGVLWRGWGINGADGQRSSDYMSTPLGGGDGISLASNGQYAIIEWDGASDYSNPVYDRDTGSYTWTKRDSSFDFEVILNKDVNFAEGQYEIFMSYNNLDFGTTDGRGSIGLQGFKGPIYSWGPFSEYLGAVYKLNHLDEVLSDDLVVCYDYVGPESSQFEVTAWVDVTPSAASQTLEFTAVSSIEGMADINLSHALNVVGNITMGDLNDMTTEEEVSVSFPVYYADENNSVNTISASGDGIEFSAESNESGGMLTITPVLDYFGETQVTVTVSDVENPSDSVSTTFMLTVTDVYDEPAPVIEEEKKKKSSGGSLSIAAILMLLIAGIRRRAIIKVA
jgi:subtilisin family serine protease